jgi:uncharacterized protein
MKFHRETGEDSLRISGYGDGFVNVAQRRMEQTFALHAESLHALGELGTVEQLTWNDLSCLHAEPPEILILGTGATQIFPSQALYFELASRRIGLEVMSTAAACRTFNILRAEGRSVAAVMMIPPGAAGA